MEFLLLQIRKKAFDPLEHNFIFATLTRFGFGQEFIQWELTLFADDVIIFCQRYSILNLMDVDLIDDDGKFSSWEKALQKFN